MTNGCDTTEAIWSKHDQVIRLGKSLDYVYEIMGVLKLWTSRSGTAKRPYRAVNALRESSYYSIYMSSSLDERYYA